MLGIYWRAHASLKINETYWNDKIIGIYTGIYRSAHNEWFTRYDFKDSIYNVMADGISDCVTRRGKYAGYKYGDVVEFAEKPNSTGDNYTQPNWNALVYHNFLARAIKIDGNKVDPLDLAIIRAKHAVLDKYMGQVKDVKRNIDYAYEVVLDYMRNLDLEEFIREWNDRRWCLDIEDSEYKKWRHDLRSVLADSKGDTPELEKSRKECLSRDYCDDCDDSDGALEAIHNRVAGLNTLIAPLKDHLKDMKQFIWRGEVTRLIESYPTILKIGAKKGRKMHPIRFCGSDVGFGNLFRISIGAKGDLNMIGYSTFLKPGECNISFLRPNQKYETVSKSPISETRIVNFPNLNKGYKYETREYSPERIEQEAKQKSEGIIRLEKYIGETYYVCNGIGHKVKEETSANQTLLGQNNISNIYNLKMSRDKTTEEYSPYRVRQELKKKGKVLTLERDTYETHYIHGGENNLVKREVAERVRSLSKSPIQWRPY